MRQGDVGVTFSITHGDAHVAPSSARTDALGYAAVALAHGSRIDTIGVKATADGGSASFSVFVVAEAAVSIAFANRVIVIDSGAATAVAATGTDRFGNTIPASAIGLTVRASTVLDASAGRYVGRQPGQSIVLASSGSARDSQLVVVARPESPVVSLDLGAFSVRADTTFTTTARVDMRGDRQRVGSILLTLTWNPAVLTYQSDADGASGANALVNATAAPQGRLTLALANTGGFGGAFDLRRVTFRAAIVAGRAGTLAIATSEMITASSLTSLIPRTVSVTHPVVTR